MVFGIRPLREITEKDVRALVNAEMAEHLQLEYKSVRYEDNDRSRREFLQDICMLANAAGGVLLVGLPELRGEDGHPSLGLSMASY
jgi:predicted HTH transcriptional regulator